LDILLFADDVILFVNSEDDLQRSIYQFELTAEKISMKISIDKIKVMAFKGKEHIHSKICVYDKIIKQVSSFKYLGYNISYEKDIHISTKILNYSRAMGIISQIFKPSLVQKHTRTKVYKTLARPVLTDGIEAWTICKSDRPRITANEMKFLRRTAGCTKLGKKRNTEILQELNINSVLEHIDQYRNNRKQHAQRMDRSRIPPQIMTYRPKGIRSLVNPLKLWRETVTGH
jgi:hypothetical protein